MNPVKGNTTKLIIVSTSILITYVSILFNEKLNPVTGEELEIAASKIPAFKPGKGLKDIVNRD
jgi:hypothetical protein